MPLQPGTDFPWDEIAYPERLEARFWSKVRRGAPDECWLWLGTRNGRYGEIAVWIDEKKHKIGAHRLAYFLHHARGPAQGWVLHRCDNCLCVNPQHLFDGTQSSNTADRTHKGRSSRGSQRHNAKLTEGLVAEMLAAHRAGTSIISLSHRYGVSFNTVWLIVRGLAWRHVPR